MSEQEKVYTGTDMFYDPLRRDIAFVGNELATMSGIENVRTQLYLRLLCEKGELAYYPEYGTDLYRMLSKSMTPGKIAEAEQEVTNTILQDPRVDRVEDVIITPRDDSVSIAAQVTVQGITFDLVLEEGL